MTMNKREQAEFDEVREDNLRLRAMLNLNGRPPVPVPPLGGMGDIQTLWWVLESRLDENGCRIGSCYGQGQRDGPYGHKNDLASTHWSQGPGTFFSSRTDALLALRWKVVDRFSRLLAAIDAEIGREP